MKAGTIPPNREDLVTYSAEKVTTTDFEMAKTWLAGVPVAAALDPLSDPYAFVSDQHKCQKALAEAQGPIPGNKFDLVSASEGVSSPPSQSQQGSVVAAISSTTVASVDSGRTGVSSNYTSSDLIPDQAHAFDALKAAHKINLCESGLR